MKIMLGTHAVIRGYWPAFDHIVPRLSYHTEAE
jgi:hypothetical protein